MEGDGGHGGDSHGWRAVGEVEMLRSCWRLPEKVRGFGGSHWEEEED